MESYHGWKIDKDNLMAGPISCSMIKSFDVNPYAWYVAPEFVPTAAMKLGSLYDAALTDPEALESMIDLPSPLEPFQVLPFDSLRTNAAKVWKKAAESDGFRVMTQKQADDEINELDEKRQLVISKINHVKAGADVVRNHPIAGKILDGAEFQVGIVGDIGGIPAKCLLDILPSIEGDYSETIFDYKTISTGLDDESIRKVIGRLRYHWQAGFYRTMLNNVSEDRICDEFGFIFQCMHTHEVRVVMLSPDALSLGSRAIGNALKGFRTAAEHGIKSRYLTTSEAVELMPFHAMNEEDTLIKNQTTETE